MRYMRGETTALAAQAEDARTALLLEDLRGWEEHDAEGATQFVFYCPLTDDLDARRAAIEARLGRVVAWSTVDEEDWAHAWKRFWKPQRIGRHIVVKPTWETFVPEPDDIVIELDPGMAFGTGTHATTRMCLEWLEQLVEAGQRVLDVGTGSGILVVTALRLGAGEALGIDNDPVAVRTARENIVLNGVADRARIAEGDLIDAVMEHERFELVIANIVADAIIALAPQVIPYLSEGGAFVASGIIIERVSEVRVALDAAGLVEQEWRPDGEWASVCARRTA